MPKKISKQSKKLSDLDSLEAENESEDDVFDADFEDLTDEKK